DGQKYKKEIEADVAEAANFGARGTPSFFINGKSLRGAQPFPAFKTAIDAALADAEAAVKRGVKPRDLYAELTKAGLEKASAAAAPPARRRHHRLQGDGRRRAGARGQERQGNDRRVVGLPVPVLRARGADGRPGAQGLPERRADRLQAAAAAVPQQRARGGRG